MSGSASLRKSRCAAGSYLEIGSRAECRRRSSQCAPPDSSTHRRRFLPSTRRCRAPRVCGGSLFPQEGCPLARHGREGQDPAASDFGVCVAGPVRPLVAVPLGSSLPHAHKAHKAPANKPPLAHRRETDREIRITDARPNAVAPAMSAAASGGNGPIPFRLACRIMNWPLSTSLSALCLVLSPQKREQQPCVYSYCGSILGAWLVSPDPIGIISTSTRASTTTRTPAHIGGLALLSPLPVLGSSVQSLALLFAVVAALVRTRLCTR